MITRQYQRLKVKCLISFQNVNYSQISMKPLIKYIHHAKNDRTAVIRYQTLKLSIDDYKTKRDG